MLIKDYDCENMKHRNFLGNFQFGNCLTSTNIYIVHAHSSYVAFSIV